MKDLHLEYVSNSQDKQPRKKIDKGFEHFIQEDTSITNK